LAGAGFNFKPVLLTDGWLRGAVTVFFGDPLAVLVGDFLGAGAGTGSSRSTHFLGDLGGDLVGLGGADTGGVGSASLR